jgi:hypothetical protein
MKHLQFFESWVLNEWVLRKHWDIERGSKTHNLSRIVPRSSAHADGWECKDFLEINSEGKSLGKKISYKEFREKSGLSREELVEKISESLYIFLHGRKITTTKYPDDELHRYVYLGKVAFKVGNQFFSPLFITYDGVDPREASEGIWGDVKDNLGYTFMYLSPHSTVIDFKKFLKNDDNRLEKYRHLSIEDYMQSRVKTTDLVNKNYTVFIPDTPDWVEIVKKQSDTGRSFWEEGKREEISPEQRAWNSLFRESQAVFDKGTTIYRDGKFYELSYFEPTPDDLLRKFQANKEATFIIQDGSEKKMMKLKPDSTVTVVSPKDTGEKEMGGFEGAASKKDARIAKTYTVQSFVRSIDEKKKVKVNIKGIVKDIFVVLPDGTPVYSKFSKP